MHGKTGHAEASGDAVFTQHGIARQPLAQALGQHLGLFGAGLGQFFHLSHRYAPALEGGIARYLKRPAIAHSEYLQYAAETGLAATLLLIGLSAWLVCVAARRTKTAPPESRAIQEAALLVALALATHGLVDNNWTVPVIAASHAGVLAGLE